MKTVQNSSLLQGRRHTPHAATLPVAAFEGTEGKDAALRAGAERWDATT